MENIDELTKQIVEKTAQRVSEDLKNKFITAEELDKILDKFHNEIQTAVPGNNENKDEDEFFKALVQGRFKATGDITNTTDAGALIPSTVANKIIEQVTQASWVRKIATVFPDSKGTLFVKQNGATAYRTPEQTAPNSGNPSVLSFKGIDYDTYDAVADTIVSNKLLVQAKPAIRQYIYKQLGEAFGNLEMKEFILGTTANHEFEGLYSNANIPIVTAKTGHTTIDTIDYDDLLDLFSAVADQVQRTGVWIVSAEFIKVVKKLKDNNGLPIFDAGAHSIWNRPYYVNPHLDTSGTDNPIAYFGDFKRAYYIFDPGTITFATTNQGKELVSTRQTYMIAFATTGARVVDETAIAGLKLSAT
jgi:HK97 family phage major capsid protein